jgi:diacylglycerol kinase family enzyme
MRILSIGKKIEYKTLDITSIETSSLPEHHDIKQFDYVIINGGDGTIRRVLTQLHTLEKKPIFILNPTGSFNVVTKIHRAPKIETVLQILAEGETPKTQKHHLFKMNEELFLFSAGNMGDLQHIFLSETLRFGWLKHGILKYILAVIFLFPVHLIMTPFMLMSKTRFFIFTPLRFIRKFGTFYGEVQKIDIDLDNEYNMLELDGDIVNVKGRHLKIRPAGNVRVVTQ